MMSEGDLIKLIRSVVRKEFAQIMMAKVTDTTDSYSGSMLRFKTDSEIDGLRMIQPYGFACRPPTDTECLVSPINSDPSHLVIVGQFDKGNRPLVQDGESVLYGPDGQIVYMKTGGDVIVGDYVSASGTIQPTYRAKLGMDGTRSLKNLVGEISLSPTGAVALNGGTGASHGAALGDIVETRLQALELALSNFLAGDISHTHEVISVGSPTGPPVPAPVLFVAVATPVSSQTVSISL